FLDALDNVSIAVSVETSQHRLLQEQPLWPRIGDKGLPAKTLAASSDGVFLASDVGYLVAGFLDHAFLAAQRASTPAHVLGGLLDLLFPGNAEQPVHPMVCDHEVNRL